MNADVALLQAALVGYQSELTRIDLAIGEIRVRLGQAGAAPVSEAPVQRPRRKMSAAARKRIAAAQKKRWAEYKRLKG